MVATVEDVLMARKRTVEDDELSRGQKTALGPSAIRLEIPLHDLRPHHMAELAEKLRGVANALEFVSKRHDLSLYLQIAEVRREVERVKQWTQEKTGRYRWIYRK